MPDAPCLLVLGAGASRRMRGGDKLLEPVEGAPLLSVLCQRGLDANLSVRVTLPSLDHPRALVLDGLDVTRIAVHAWAEGMSASLRSGLEGISAPSVLILPGDMPEITSQDMAQIAAAPGQIVQATAPDGTPGHPVRFDARFYGDLKSLSGDIGARNVLKSHAALVTRVALPGRHAVTDLDTPEDWSAWRASRGAGLAKPGN